MFGNMAWLNEPPEWSVEGSRLQVVTGDRTDFWRSTFYGFIRDDGHFMYMSASGDFSASVSIGARYEELYDQCGLMARVDERSWMKMGVEYTDGTECLSAVVTRGFSDWSIAPTPAYDGELRLRVTRHGEALRAEYSKGDSGWRMLRLAHLGMPETVMVGVMCCSPQRSGFHAEFRDFILGPPAPPPG
jgi:uncharacterized protein